MDNETPDQIPEYLLILDNDSWYEEIFTDAVLDDPVMEVAALNLPAPKRERRAGEVSATAAKPVATVSSVATKVAAAPSAPAATTPDNQPPMSITRWLQQWKTMLKEENGEDVLKEWNAKHVTALLRLLGWLDGQNLPTKLGLAKGLTSAQGMHSTGTSYIYTVYSAQAAKNVLDALRPYFVEHHYSVAQIPLSPVGETTPPAPKGTSSATPTTATAPSTLAAPDPTAQTMTQLMKAWKSEVFVNEQGETLLAGWSAKHVVALLRRWGWLDATSMPTALGIEKGISTAASKYPGAQPFAVYSDAAAKRVLAKLCEHFNEHGFSPEKAIPTAGTPVVSSAAGGDKATAAPVSAAALNLPKREAYSLSQCLRKWQAEHPENAALQALTAAAINRRLTKLGWIVTDAEGNKVPSEFAVSLGLMPATWRDSTTQKERRYALYTPPAMELVYEQVLQLLGERGQGRRGW